MDLPLPDWIGILTKLGLPVSTIIMGLMWWLSERKRSQAEERSREDRERYEEDLRDIIRESIESNKNTSFALSTLVSLLGSNPKKGRG